MTKDEILGRFMLIVSQTLIYSGHNLVSQREREELAALIGAWEALQGQEEKENSGMNMDEHPELLEAER